ncbi:MAG: DNA methyltransferase [Pseudomonadota bacterium]
MTPEAFVAKWSEATTKERAASQEHFIDLCRVLGEKTPHEADPAGEWYAFEKGVEKTGAGRGWADVWKKGCFGWEYKSKSGGRASTMSGALKQLQLYALALESPPLLIVSDIDTIEIHTAFQNAVQEVHFIRLEELVDPDKLKLLRWAFREPERLRPKRTRNQITAEAAGQFAELAYTLRGEGHDPLEVAHFLNRLLFCMFAEDAGLLKSDLFTGIAEQGVEHPDHFDQIVTRLFQAMQTGGPFGTDIIDWFNGGLFDNDDTLPVTLAQIRTIRDLARMDWSQIEPAIFGTLFERGLDPAKRSQLGAHYTDPDSIMRLVNPTIVEPLMEEWRATRAEISKQMEHMERVKTKAATRKRRKAAEDAFFGFLEKLRNFRVLDPACGSGNFLYLSLQALKRIEHRANIEAEALGLARQAPMVGPEAVMGIELNAYAAELARVTVWIGEIQWMLDHGYSLSKDPILKSLDTIEQRDAILNEDGTEPDWPPADLIVGNPPFLGNKKMLAELGESYVRSLRALYTAGMPGGVDLVTYWYEKARAQLVAGLVERVGLVATNSIRGGANRSVVDSICRDAEIFDSWSDEPWVNEGAAVRVSLICFGMPIAGRQKHLNGDTVGAIYADLTGDTHGATDLTLARVLPENSGVAFIGGMKKGPFYVPGETARKWLL